VATDAWTGALLSLSGLVVGAGISELRDWWKERKTRRRVAITLTAELVAMSDMVANCASFANLAELGLRDGLLLNTQMLVAHLPPDPAAYRALVGQLPLLDIDTVSAVVAFYGSLDLANRLSLHHTTAQPVPASHVPLLRNAWRALTRCALIAMQHMGKYEPPLNHQNDAAQLADLITDLNDVASRKSPRVEIDIAKGTMRIGRGGVRK